MSALVNGGHGRRIVEDKTAVRRSQVPVSKAVDWDHQKRVSIWDDRLAMGGRFSRNKEKKKASQTIGNATIKPMAVGLGAGAAAGAGVAHLTGRSKLLPALSAGLAGQLVGGSIGRSRGIRLAERKGELKVPASKSQAPVSKYVGYSGLPDSQRKSMRRGLVPGTAMAGAAGTAAGIYRGGGMPARSAIPMTLAGGAAGAGVGHLSGKAAEAMVQRKRRKQVTKAWNPKTWAASTERKMKATEHNVREAINRRRTPKTGRVKTKLNEMSTRALEPVITPIVRSTAKPMIAAAGGAGVVGGYAGAKVGQHRHVEKYYSENRNATPSELSNAKAEHRRKHPIKSRLQRQDYSQGQAFADDDGNRGVNFGARRPSDSDWAGKRVKTFSRHVGGEKVGKAEDWKNISEHQRRVVDAKRTQRRGSSMTGWGTVIGVGGMYGAMLSAKGKGGAFHQAGRIGSALRHGKNLRSMQGEPMPGFKMNPNDIHAKIKSRNRVQTGMDYARHYPAGATLLGGGGLMAGGIGTQYAGLANQRRHERAIGVQRKATNAKAKAAVGKADRAYDPEHKRQRRLGAYEAGLGLAGAALLAHGGRGTFKATKLYRRSATHTNARLARAGSKHGIPTNFISHSPMSGAELAGGTAALGGAAGVHYKSNRSTGRTYG